MIDDFTEVKNTEKTPVKKPTLVMVFGILNIVFGCYFLVRIIHSWYKMIAEICKNPEKITWSGIPALLLLILSIGLAIWLIVLGIGLLMMKRWSRRGSVMYARIQIVLIIITLGVYFVSSFLGRAPLPKDGLGAFIFAMCIGLTRNLIYPVLLLIFMQTNKVKQAFTAIGG